jgi:hypothetical protein
MKRFTIKGVNTPFPIDMLRHDECWPATVQDSEKIKISFGYRHGRRVRWQLDLISKNDGSPSVERWLSFSVEVVSDEKIKDAPDKADKSGRR